MSGEDKFNRREKLSNNRIESMKHQPNKGCANHSMGWKTLQTGLTTQILISVGSIVAARAVV